MEQLQKRIAALEQKVGAGSERENARFFCAGAPVVGLINEVANHSPPPSV
jgi:hypothetical protein